MDDDQNMKIYEKNIDLFEQEILKINEKYKNINTLKQIQSDSDDEIEKNIVIEILNEIEILNKDDDKNKNIIQEQIDFLLSITTLERLDEICDNILKMLSDEKIIDQIMTIFMNQYENKYVLEILSKKINEKNFEKIINTKILELITKNFLYIFVYLEEFIFNKLVTSINNKILIECLFIKIVII